MALSAGLGCTGGGVANNTASLGGNTPGQRGKIRATFKNNTPFRAIFTFGTYDPDNKAFTPQLGQFSVDPDPTKRLEGNTESNVVSFDCGRAFSLGGTEFIQRLKEAKLVANLSEDALQPGISFSDRPLDDPDAGKPTAGHAPEVLTFQGTQYPCDGLLVYSLEVDATQPSGFRVDLEVSPP